MMSLRRLALVALPLGLAACSSFGRKERDPERAAQAEIKRYFSQVQDAFKAMDANEVAGLFDPNIMRPMSRSQILDWATKFFTQYKDVRFHVDRLTFETLAPDAAQVRLAFRVTTEAGKGDFGGLERDYLGKAGGRWRITAWEKLPNKKRSEAD